MDTDTISFQYKGFKLVNYEFKNGFHSVTMQNSDGYKIHANTRESNYLEHAAETVQEFYYDFQQEQMY